MEVKKVNKFVWLIPVIFLLVAVSLFSGFVFPFFCLEDIEKVDVSFVIVPTFFGMMAFFSYCVIKRYSSLGFIIPQKVNDIIGGIEGVHDKPILENIKKCIVIKGYDIYLVNPYYFHFTHSRNINSIVILVKINGTLTESEIRHAGFKLNIERIGGYVFVIEYYDIIFRFKHDKLMTKIDLLMSKINNTSCSDFSGND